MMDEAYKVGTDRWAVRCGGVATTDGPAVRPYLNASAEVARLR